jgi:hypothetical protein
MKALWPAGSRRPLWLQRVDAHARDIEKEQAGSLCNGIQRAFGSM